MPTVIDLEEIQARLNSARPWAESERTRPENLLPRSLVVRLWTLMTEMYGHRWTSAFGDEIDPHNVWGAALRGLDETQIRHGLGQCVATGLDWPPSAPEFRSLCTNGGSWEHRQVEAADEAWKRRALPDMSQQNEAAIDDIRASIRAMLR